MIDVPGMEFAVFFFILFSCITHGGSSYRSVFGPRATFFELWF